MKARVAVVTPSPTPYRAPFFRSLAARDDLALKVFYLTRGSATRAWNVDVSGFDHEFLGGFGIPIGGKDMARYRVNPSIIARLAAGRFDVVVVSGYNHLTTQAAILYCAGSGTPWCMMSESHLAKPRSAAKRLLKKALLTPVLRTMGAAMVTGTLARRYVESFGVPRDAVYIVANTPDIEFLRLERRRLAPRRVAIRQLMGVDGRRVILFVGRLLEEKGVRVLLDAFARMTLSQADLVLLLAGDGPRRKEFEALAAASGLPGVRFLGFESQAQLVELYAAADVFVLPSLVEPWGVVVNEAMASGLPVVLSDQVGAAADLVIDGANGFVVPAGDSAALAACLSDVLSDEGRRAAMGRRSEEVVSAWNYEASVEGFRGAIETAVRRKGLQPWVRESARCFSSL